MKKKVRMNKSKTVRFKKQLHIPFLILFLLVVAVCIVSGYLYSSKIFVKPQFNDALPTAPPPSAAQYNQYTTNPTLTTQLALLTENGPQILTTLHRE